MLEALRATSLTARVDVAGLTPGSSRLPVLVSVPDDLGLAVEAVTPDSVEVLLAGALREVAPSGESDSLEEGDSDDAPQSPRPSAAPTPPPSPRAAP